ncbi:MAG: hypothetical protein IPJ33_20400 [Gammaproteobacteria bacterium]|jgi:hypothetical protein|nr:hypothetical protein [Gammaproteobacteria bacterium]MBP6053153.1 hypothetical protein [Pseudomonadales bacterium]MBK6584544.1 hypothetical protein [Gammaproteobacteria bacterium]MBK7169200.1 hypothetical protein [Gammaproteobacteria bacterium]MBK7519952.1 hypothetical protein [Gammaproteobacteria bacterium]
MNIEAPGTVRTGLLIMLAAPLLLVAVDPDWTTVDSHLHHGHLRPDRPLPADRRHSLEGGTRLNPMPGILRQALPQPPVLMSAP